MTRLIIFLTSERIEVYLTNPFLNFKIQEEEIDVKFNKGMMKNDPSDRFREAEINDLEVKQREVCNVVELIKMQEKKSKKRNSINRYLGGRE